MTGAIQARADGPLVLSVNPGSSSLKCAVRTGPTAAPLLAVSVERIGSAGGVLHASDRADEAFSGTMAAALQAVARVLADRGLLPDAIAHRMVHGGPGHVEPEVVGDALIGDLRAIVPLAPLHLPDAIAALELARSTWPGAVHIACFDTAFHQSLPETSRRLPVAPELDALGIRRYGFHGLSLESVLLSSPDLGDAVVAHLGSGCSITAIGADRQPRHTTMSLTPTSGILSATRSGDLDPDIPLYLMEHHGYSIAEVRDLLSRQSGIAGISGGRRDLRDLQDAADSNGALARAIFVRDCAMAIAACATTLDDWRTLVFTGGIGEHNAAVRDAICQRLRLRDVEVRVIAADEERVLDRHARAVLAAAGATDR